MSIKEPKIKIEIDLADLYHEVEENEGGGSFDLKTIFKDAVDREIKQAMRNEISDIVRAEILKFIKNDLLIEIKTEMNMKLKDFMTKHILPDHYGKEKTADKYLQDCFEDMLSSKHSVLVAEVNTIAEKWGKALKQQYDVAYASKLVQTLNDQGLLLPNVAQLLLDKG